MNERLIVFGDDGSTYADRAWLWINHQRWSGWAVEVVNTRYDPGDLWSDDLPVRLHRWQPDTPRKPFAECGLGDVRHLQATADARLVLDSRHDADLIVVGPKGRFGLKALLLGSTAEHLLHHPPAPLVIAKTPDSAQHILVCTDGSQHAHRAIETFARLPLAAQASHVSVLGVVDTLASDRQVVTTGLERAAQTLAEFDPEIVLAEAEEQVAATLLEHANSLPAHLLVMGTRGHTGLRRVLVGSTAGAIARLATAAVLIVPPPSKDEGSGRSDP